ncbi:hypothetical protein D3C73_1255160 [compost metagenome]
MQFNATQLFSTLVVGVLAVNRLLVGSQDDLQFFFCLLIGGGHMHALIGVRGPRQTMVHHILRVTRSLQGVAVTREIASQMLERFGAGSNRRRKCRYKSRPAHIGGALHAGLAQGHWHDAIERTLVGCWHDALNDCAFVVTGFKADRFVFDLLVPKFKHQIEVFLHQR